MTRNFHELVAAQKAEGKSACIALKCEFDKNKQGTCTADVIVASTIALFEATKHVAFAYVVNLESYLERGVEGSVAMFLIFAHIRALAPNIPIILHAEYSHTGNPNADNVKFAFGFLGADAVTVNPHRGREALQPFLEYGNKGIIFPSDIPAFTGAHHGLMEHHNPVNQYN